MGTKQEHIIEVEETLRKDLLFLHSKEELDEMFPGFIGGYQAKHRFSVLVDMVRHPEVYEGKAKTPQRWLILPCENTSGAGRTKLAHVVIEALGLPCIELSPKEAIEKGCSFSELIQKGFEKARALKRAVVFMDDINRYCYSRIKRKDLSKYDSYLVLNENLKRLDETPGVLFLGTASNYRFLLDKSNNERFYKTVMLFFPDDWERGQIIRHCLGDAKLCPELTVEYLTRMFINMFYSKIESILNDAKMISARARHDCLTEDDLFQALHHYASSDAAHRKALTMEQRKRIAYHEAGHMYVAYRLFPESISYSTILDGGDSGGMTLLFYSLKDRVNDAGHILRKMMISLAGGCALDVMTGQKFAGNGSDIDHALTTVDWILAYGTAGAEYAFDFGTAELSSVHHFKDSAYNSVLIDFEKSIVQIYQRRVLRLLANHRETVEALANALAKDGILMNSKAREIICSIEGSIKPYRPIGRKSERNFVTDSITASTEKDSKAK